MSTVTTTPGRSLNLAVPCDLAAVREAARQLRAFLEQQGLNGTDLDAWELITAEAGNNAVEHTPPEALNIPVELGMRVTPSDAELVVVDHTPGFELPDNPQLPDDPLSESGRGLFLMRALSDSVRYLRGRDENVLVIKKRRSSQATPSSDPQQSVEMAVLETTIHTMTEELAASYESLSAIFRFTAELNRGSINAVFTERWLHELRQIVAADWFVLRLADPSVTHLAVSHCSRNDAGLTPLLLKGATQTSSSIESRAAVSRQDMWFDAANPFPPDDPLALFGFPASGLAHPLYVNTELVGVLTVGRFTRQHPFTAGQVNIIHTFADFLGIQLRNARIQEDHLRTRLVTRELEIAATIQRSLLPVRLPEPDGFRLAGFCESASKVGGDYFDAVLVPDRGLLLVIADVMGKGVPAAMFAAIFRSHVHARPDLAVNPGEFLTWLNRALYPDLDRVEMFVTAQVVFLDQKRRELRIASAGHCPLLVRHADGTIKEGDADGPPLGIDGDLVFTDHTEPVHEGMCFLMYTDGLIEARNPAGDLLGLERLKSWFGSPRLKGAPVAAIEAGLVKLAREFQGSAPAADDLTFVLVADDPASAGGAHIGPGNLHVAY